MKNSARFLLLLLTTLMLSHLALSQVRELASPASPGSGQPNLTVSRAGKIYLSWIDRLGNGRHTLRFATLETMGWSTPQTIAEGDNWFVNWADFPSMIVLPDGSMAAHWLAKSSSGKFSYDVNIARSVDGGKTWTKPMTPHRDGTPTEHGFVSLFAAKNNALGAVWLDGRAMTGGESHSNDHGHGEMTLRYATIHRDNTMTDEAALDTRVCECCQTSAAMTSEGAVVVYRDRSEKEMRDISIVRFTNGKWSAPQPVYPDGWEINGCPVNGPSVAAAGKRVAVAWFTAVNNQARVKLVFSDDAGKTFGKPVIIDDGNPAGRVETLLLKDGSALICWLEKTSEGGAVRVRRVMANGQRENSLTVAPSGTARSNGFPQMAISGKTIVFAWVSDRVLTAQMSLPR